MPATAGTFLFRAPGISGRWSRSALRSSHQRGTARLVSSFARTTNSTCSPVAVTSNCSHPRAAISIPSAPDHHFRLTREFTSSSSIAMPTSAETKDYRFNHTMIRVKDPVKSLHFYCDILGMDVIDEHDAGDFKLFFLAYGNSASANAPTRAHREAILELTWNKGTEKEEGQVYHNGNDQPQGFGHTCISVPDLQEAYQRFEKMGVDFKKRPQDGRMRNIMFLHDPDRYWVEVIAQNKKDV